MTNTALKCCLALLVGYASWGHTQVQQVNKDAPALTIQTVATYTDNLNPTLDTELDAWGLAIRPSGKLVSMGEGGALQFDYAANLEYFSLQDDVAELDDSVDFNSVKASLLGRLYLGDAWMFDVNVQHATQTQKFGTGISRLSKDVLEADTLRRNTGDVSLIYGRDPLNRFISFTAGVEDSQYDTQDDTDIYDLNVTFLKIYSGFRYSSKARFLARLEAREEDFENPTREDSDFYQVLLGFDWQPSGKSSVEALVGVYQRSFDVSDDNDGFIWLFSYDYQPNDLWRFEIGSSRRSQASDIEFTSDTVTQDVMTRIQLTPSEQWRLSADAKVVQTTFFQNALELDQDELSASLELAYLLTSFHSVGLRIGSNSIETSNGFIDYRQNEVALVWQYEF